MVVLLLGEIRLTKKNFRGENMNQKLYWAPTIIVSVIEAIAIYHNIGKSLCQSLKASPHTQLSLSPS